MKTHKRTTIEIVSTSIVIILAISFALPIPRSYLLRAGMFFLARKVKQGQMRLLCETNHHALLEACRELSKQVTSGELRPNTYYIRSREHPPEVSQFPEMILDLSPRSVTIDRDGRVTLQMGGGFANYGVFAYPEDYKEPYRNFIYGNIRIIDGLWYHDAEYEGSPKHQKRIKAFIGGYGGQTSMALPRN